MNKIALLTIASSFSLISSCSDHNNIATNVDIFNDLSTNDPKPSLSSKLTGEIISNKEINGKTECGIEVKKTTLERQSATGGHCTNKDGKILYVVKCDYSNNLPHCSIR